MNKKFWFYFNAALASIASLATLFCAVAPDSWLPNPRTWCFAIIFLAVIFIICSYYSWYQTELKEKISIKINPNLRVNVFKGDLFEQKDIIVIPVNEYFDMQVDDVIIAHRTLHGMFVDKYFKDNTEELYRIISAQLAGIAFTEVNGRIHSGARSRKYPIGTCVKVEKNGKIFVLFALTHFDHEDKAFLPKEEFASAIVSLMKYLSEIANNRPVSMPLFGTGLARLNETHQRVLLFILDTIDFSCPVSINAGLNIVVYSGDMAKVNLNKAEEFMSETIREEI